VDGEKEEVDMSSDTSSAERAHPVAGGSPGEDELAGRVTGRRHWYHLRPQPRCRADLMGFNYTWWTVIGVIIVVVIAIFPF
jgi:hypothetical protein